VVEPPVEVVVETKTVVVVSPVVVVDPAMVVVVSGTVVVVAGTPVPQANQWLMTGTLPPLFSGEIRSSYAISAQPSARSRAVGFARPATANGRRRGSGSEHSRVRWV